MNQMNPTKKNMENLDLNPGQMVCLVPYWGGVLCGVGFSLGVTIYADNSCDYGQRSLYVP